MNEVPSVGDTMTQDEADQLTERVAWLERKMVRVLWVAGVGDFGVRWLRRRLHHRQVLWVAFDTCGNRNLDHGPASFCSGKSSKARRDISSSLIRNPVPPVP